MELLFTIILAFLAGGKVTTVSGLSWTPPKNVKAVVGSFLQYLGAVCNVS
jgi:hypothetical protein